MNVSETKKEILNLVAVGNYMKNAGNMSGAHRETASFYYLFFADNKGYMQPDETLIKLSIGCFFDFNMV